MYVVSRVRRLNVDLKTTALATDTGAAGPKEPQFGETEIICLN